MAKTYEYTFENGNKYTGTTEDKKFFIHHLTKNEKEEFGKIISKRLLTEEEIKAYNHKVEKFLTWI